MGVERMIKLERILKIQRGKMWTGYIWLRTGTNGKFLWTQ